jgi:hypothetical protein
MTGHRLLAILAALGGAACSDVLDPFRASAETHGLRVHAISTQLIEGSETLLQPTRGYTLLGEGQVEFVSRRPQVVRVEGFRLIGIAPGMAWIVGREGRSIDSVQVTVRFSNLGTEQVGIRIGDAPASFRIHSAAMLTEYLFRSPVSDPIHGWGTTIAATTGSVTPGCCSVAGDTVLWVNFQSVPAVGDRLMTGSNIVIDQDIRQYGPDDIKLIIRDADGHQRFLLPVRETTLRIDVYAPPSAGVDGTIAGILTFEAASFRRVVSRDGSVTVTPASDRTVLVHAEFRSTLVYRYLEFGDGP